MMRLSVAELRDNAARRWSEQHSHFRQHWHWQVVPSEKLDLARAGKAKPHIYRAPSGEHRTGR